MATESKSVLKTTFAAVDADNGNKVTKTYSLNNPKDDLIEATVKSWMTDAISKNAIMVKDNILATVAEKAEIVKTETTTLFESKASD